MLGALLNCVIVLALDETRLVNNSCSSATILLFVSLSRSVHSSKNLVNNRSWFFQIDLAHHQFPHGFQAGFVARHFFLDESRKLIPSSNITSASFRSHNILASGRPCKFLSHGTTRAGMSSHDLGFERGWRVQNFWAFNLQ